MPKFTNGIGDDFLAARAETLKETAPQLDTGFLERLGYHGITAIPNAARGLASAAANIGGIGLPELDPEIASLTKLQGATGGVGMAADVIGGLGTMGLELAATGGVGRLAGLGRLAKSRPLAGRIATDALSFGVLGASEDRLTGLEQAAEGAGYGALTGMGRSARLLPAAALAMLSERFFDREGETPIMPGSEVSRGDLAGVAGFLTALLPGKVGMRPPPTIANAVGTDFANIAKSQPQPPLALMDRAMTGQVIDDLPPEVVYAGGRGMPSRLLEDPATMAGANLRERFGYNPAAIGDPSLQNLVAPQANYSAAESAMGILNPQVETPALAKVKSKIHKLPEFMRTEGGGVDPELLNSIGMPLLRTGLGAAGGAGIAEAAGVDPTFGALMGAGAVNLPAAMKMGLATAQKIFAPIAKQDNMGAIRDPYAIQPEGRERIISTAIRLPDGQVVTGDTWNAKHMTLVKEAMGADADPNSLLDNMGFLVEDAGGNIQWANREQAMGIARKSGQVRDDVRDARLISEMLIDEPVVKNDMGSFAKKLAAQVNHGAKKMARDAEEMYDFNLTKGETIYSSSTGKTYQFVGKAPPRDMPTLIEKEDGKMGYKRDKDGKVIKTNRPMIYVKDEEGNINPHFVTKEDGTPFWNKNLDKPEPVKVFEGLRSLKNQGGFIFPEMNAAMARSGIGALGGGAIGGATVDDSKEGFMYGAMIGAATLGAGPSLARSIVAGLGRTRAIPPPSGKASVPKSWMNLAKNWGQTIEEASGRALATSAKASDRFLRFVDKAFEITMPAAVKETLISARGAASQLLSVMDDALTKVSLRFKPDQALKDLAQEHLDGTIDAATFLQRAVASTPSDVNAAKFAEFIVAGREAVNGLQRMTAEGVGDPKMRKIINDSIGKYLTRSYKIFSDKAWEPTVNSIDNLVTEIHNKKVWNNATPADIRTALEQYVREVKQAKGVYKGFGGAHGEKINQAVLKERKDLSPAWKEFLGEVRDPTERLYQTVFRLRPMAEASRYMSDLVNLKEEGWMPHRFSTYTEKDAFEQGLLQQLQNAPDQNAAAVAQGRLEKFRLKWQGAQNVEAHPKYGALKGSIVTRNVWDTLSTFDSFTDPTSHPLLRSLAGAHTAIKLARTAFNPITVVRNFLTMPMFAVIAKAVPQDMAEAWKIMQQSDHPLRKEVMEKGIMNVDQVKTEFFKEFENVTGGKYNFGNLDLQTLGLGRFDLDTVEKMGRRGVRNWLDVYRLPDNMVRIGSYLSAKRRFAQASGKQLDDPDVIGKAVSFTNRYTMNYDTVAPAVKVARQLPFVNMFISYTAEMTRILKNLAVDIKGHAADSAEAGFAHNRMYAAFPLATLAVLPELLQSSSEAQLSDKDRAEWDRVKKMLPDYSRTRYRMGISRDEQGQFHYTDITPLIASDALNQTVKAVVQGDMQALASVNPIVGIENTPALNIVASQIVGKDLHSHREFRGAQDRIATVAKEVLPPWFPGVGAESQRFSQAHAQNEEGSRGLTNAKTGQRLTPADFWKPYYSGLKTGSTNPSVLEQRHVAEAKRDIANEVAYLNDVLRTDADESLKVNALERAKVAIAEIQENLRQLIGTRSDRN